MPRKFLKRWLPDPKKIREQRGLQFLGKLLHDPNLFHLNRHSVSTALFVGIFVCFLPIPAQMAVSAMLALIIRCNLPLAVATVWISNPVTMPPMLFACYKLGVFLLGERERRVNFEFSWEWLIHGFPAIWQPLLLGCVIAGLTLGGLAYLMVQGLWRWHVVDRWRARRQRRARKKMLEKDHS